MVPFSVAEFLPIAVAAEVVTMGGMTVSVVKVLFSP
jgi:hypothetical protein